MNTKTKTAESVVIHKSMAHIVSKAAKDGGYEFVLSDATVDRYGDIIDTEGWELDNFKNNPVALFNHNPNFPIGSWSNIGVKNKALRGTLNLAPEGTSERIDEIRRLIDANILRAVSVGFTPIDYTEYKDGSNYGYKYTKCELVETSLVSIPANPNALQVAKTLNISTATRELVFGEHAEKRTVASVKTPAVIVAKPVVRSLRAKSLDTRLLRMKSSLEGLGHNDSPLALGDDEELLTKLENLFASERQQQGR